MEKIEVTNSGYGRLTTKKESKADYNDRVTHFAVKLVTEIKKNTILNSNSRTVVAISACIMFDDFLNKNNQLMESSSFYSDLNTILLNISRVNEATGIIAQMNESNNMFDSVRLFSSTFYGELYPDDNLPKKMCFVERIETAIKKI